MAIIRRRILLPLVVLSLIGANFVKPRFEGYRIWIGDNEETDWVDVCCRYSNDGFLQFADYTPIQSVHPQQTEDGRLFIYIRKGFSEWGLEGIPNQPESFILRPIVVDPRKERN